MSQEIQGLFNWDEVDLGDNDLDHSQKFFARKHKNHERLEDLARLEKLNRELAATTLEEKDYPEDNKENVLLLTEQIKVENNSPPSPLATTQEEQRPEEFNVEVLKVPLTPNEQQPKLATARTASPQPKKTLIRACQWSTQKEVVCKTTGAVSKAMPQPPHAYQFKEIYERKKQQALREQRQQERRAREFHPRPVPNFNAIHGQLERRRIIHAITVPVTPKVLKKSRESEEKRKKRLEELNRQQQPRKFEPRPATVVREPPFVPKRETVFVEQRPFHLQSEKRMQERKKYDAAIHRALEEKQKQEMVERHRREEEEVKSLRKMASFKARPNPFK